MTSRSAGTSPDSTPFFGPSVVLPQHSVYCDGDSLTGLGGGLTPRLPTCHHEECHKSYRTLLRMANRLGKSHEVLSSHYSDGGHLTSHAHNANATNHARAGHRHHPYELPQPQGRKPSPVDMTPSPISTDDSSELPPLPHHPPAATVDNYEYYTPSTSPFLHAVRNMNMGKSRTSSRVPSRAPSPVPLHLPPAITAISSAPFGSHDSGRSTIGRSDRHHRSNRSHPSLHSPREGASEYPHYPYPRSHGGTPPGTPAPLMMGRPKRSNSGGVASQPSKHSIDALLTGHRSEPMVSTDLHYAMDATAAPTPALSVSSNSSVSGRPHHHFDDIPMSGETTYSPPLNFPPPPSRSRATSDIASPVRSLAGSPEATLTIHAAFSSAPSSSHPPLPPLIPGLPTSSTSPSFPRSSGSSPSTPNSSHSHLAHSVRIAFGMTPIHPPNYFSSRGRSTIGFGNSSVRASARGSSPPIILPPLKMGTKSGDVLLAGSEESEDVKLPHLDSLTRLVGMRESHDDMDIDDLH